MVNAWSLLYEELNGTMNKTYPIKGNIMSDETRVTPQESDEYDPIIAVGTGTAYDDPKYYVNFDLTDPINNVSIDTSNLGFEISAAATTNLDDIVLSDDVYPTIGGYDTLTLNDVNFQNTPSIEKNDIRKYEEDKSIKALQEYISTTYTGHYTSKENNVQTLDLIESVGDAESFCRSNAIKYLSRYDKKGQAKRDILKALHYSLLLYYFSGNTQENETPTRGYETF